MAHIAVESAFDTRQIASLRFWCYLRLPNGGTSTVPAPQTCMERNVSIRVSRAVARLESCEQLLIQSKVMGGGQLEPEERIHK